MTILGNEAFTSFTNQQPYSLKRIEENLEIRETVHLSNNSARYCEKIDGTKMFLGIREIIP